MTTTRDELGERLAIALISSYLEHQYPFHAPGPIKISDKLQDAMTKAVLAELDAVVVEEPAHRRTLAELVADALPMGVETFGEVPDDIEGNAQSAFDRLLMSRIPRRVEVHISAA